MASLALAHLSRHRTKYTIKLSKTAYTPNKQKNAHFVQLINGAVVVGFSLSDPPFISCHLNEFSFDTWLRQRNIE